MVAIIKNDVIGSVLGDFGKWQLRAILLIYLCKIPASWFMACILFSAPSPMQEQFHCLDTAGVNNNSNAVITIWHPELIEKNDKQFHIDFCDTLADGIEHRRVYQKIDGNRKNETNQMDELSTTVTTTPIPCDTFRHQPHIHTKVTTYDTLCSRNFIAALTQFFHLFGVEIGGILAMILLNYISPKKLMLYGMITQLIFGNIIAFVSNYKLHLMLRSICAICCAQMFTAGQMIFTDITGGKYRTSALCLYENFWSIGVIILPSIAYRFQTFTNIYLVISLPTTFYIMLWYWIPDSPRWLLAKGRLSEVKEILSKSTEYNNKNNNNNNNNNTKQLKNQLPSDLDELLRQQIVLIQNPTDNNGTGGNNGGSWLSLWKSKRLIISMIAAHIAWAVAVTNFNGMLLNIRNFGGKHLYTNVMISGCFEIVGVTIALLLILKTSRKWMWSGLINIFAGFLILTTWFIPSTLSGENTTIIMVFAMMAKTAISCSQAMLVTCTSELVSPNQRKICIFSCIVWGRMWLLGAPFIGSLSLYHTLLPITVFGLSTTVGGLASCILTTPRTTTTTINNDDKQFHKNITKGQNEEDSHSIIDKLQMNLLKDQC